MKRLIKPFLVLLLLPLSVAADVGEFDLADMRAATEYSYGTQFLKLVLTLAAFIALILGMAWVYRKFGLRRHLFGNAHALVQILERRALSPKTALFLIEVDGRRLLVGDSPSGVNFVADLSAKSQAASPPLAFKEILEQKMGV